ncbi:hypothetical protein [Streptomyces sp. LHD-70]|uniref:hypothetical protein n=1 Tax=Streptomyces sp. LHD-70 TaxID=3072140 RepID=UPI0035BE2BF5
MTAGPASPPPRSGGTGPLTGVRIVELGGIGPGPLAGMVLTGLGRGTGEDTRSVLAEAGLAGAELDRLTRQGVIRETT